MAKSTTALHNVKATDKVGQTRRSGWNFAGVTASALGECCTFATCGKLLGGSLAGAVSNELRGLDVALSPCFASLALALERGRFVCTKADVSVVGTSALQLDSGL